MKCTECNFFYKDDDEGFYYCHADPNWPAPCEEEDEE